MSDGFKASDPTQPQIERRQELVDIVHRVRNRWRMRLALRGAVIVVGGTLLALLLFASSLEALRFSSGVWRPGRATNTIAIKAHVRPIRSAMQCA